MPLASKLFSANPKLQACLIHDSAHLTPGSSGPPVELIQAALIKLRFLEPRDGLSEAGRYGSKTAAAVLNYKRFFKIINFSYQSAADNVVGKMTIASLDAHMCILESIPNVSPPLPISPPPILADRGGKAFATRAPVRSSLAESAGAGPDGPFSPPLSDLPASMQATIRRSNLAKVPGAPSMYPFVANHEGPLPADELSKRFGLFPAERALMMEIFNRMAPFGVWELIKTIRAMYFGIGSRGMFCHPHDHARAFAHMQGLATGPTRPGNPMLADISKALPVMDSKFCKDAFNVHGERDSWREIVSSGPGLHICVTNASGRARTHENYPASDFHIDAVQQGQFCSNGICVPVINGQTIGHLQTVGPWLLQQPGDWLKKHSPF